ALELAAPAEQVAEREVQLGGVGIALHRLDESVDRLVGLFVEQQVQAVEVRLRGLALRALPLTDVQARRDPAERERDRQTDQQPLQIEFHRVCEGYKPSRGGCAKATSDGTVLADSVPGVGAGGVRACRCVMR